MIGDKKVIATYLGYECRYTPTICDGPVFRWCFRGDRHEVSASRNGVMLDTGTLDATAMGQFLRLVELARSVHRRLQSLGSGPIETIIEFIVHYEQ